MPVIVSTYNREAENLKLGERTAASLKKRFGILLKKYLYPDREPVDCVITEELQSCVEQIFEDRRKAWGLPPLRRMFSLPARGNDNVVNPTQHPRRQVSMHEDGFQENCNTAGSEVCIPQNNQEMTGWAGNVAPCDTPEIERYAKMASRGLKIFEDRRKAWGLPPLRRMFSLPARGNDNIVNPTQHPRRQVSMHEDGFQENCNTAGSEVCIPQNNQEMTGWAGNVAPCDTPEIERYAKMASRGLKDSDVDTGNGARSPQDVPLQYINRGSGLTAESGRRRAFLSEQVLSGQMNVNTLENDMIEDVRVKRQQSDSRDVRLLNRRERGPPSQKDESATPANSTSDGAKRPRIENFGETPGVMGDASLRNGSVEPYMSHPLQRTAKEMEDELVKMYNQVEEFIFQLNNDHQLKMLQMKQKYEREEHELDQELEALQRKLRAREFEAMLELRRRKQMYEIEELEYYKELGRMGANKE